MRQDLRSPIGLLPTGARTPTRRSDRSALGSSFSGFVKASSPEEPLEAERGDLVVPADRVEQVDEVAGFRRVMLRVP